MSLETVAKHYTGVPIRFLPEVGMQTDPLPEEAVGSACASPTAKTCRRKSVALHNELPLVAPCSRAMFCNGPSQEAASYARRRKHFSCQRRGVESGSRTRQGQALRVASQALMEPAALQREVFSWQEKCRERTLYSIGCT